MDVYFLLSPCYSLELFLGIVARYVTKVGVIKMSELCCLSLGHEPLCISMGTDFSQASYLFCELGSSCVLITYTESVT